MSGLQPYKIQIMCIIFKSNRCQPNVMRENKLYEYYTDSKEIIER